MNEELVRKYQEAISLLQFRNPNNTYYGEFVNDGNGKVAFKLIYYKNFDTSGEWHATSTCSKVFKYMDNNEEALKYFIKVAQNRVF